DDELAPAADLHALDAGVPALDDLADTEAEVERRAAVVRRVELLAGGQGDADVVHRHGASGARLGTVADGEVGDDEVGGRGGVDEVDLGLLGHPVSLRRALLPPYWPR